MLAIKTMVQRHHVWITLLFVYALLASAALYKGSVQSPDSFTLIKWADLLIDYQFNLSSFYKDVVSGSRPFFYTLPVVILAIQKLIFKQ